MIWLVLGAILPAFLVSWLACFVIRRLAPRWGLVDQPGHRKVHTTPTPMGGGIAIWLGVIVTFACGTALLAAVSASPARTTPAWLPEIVHPAWQFAMPHVAGLNSRMPGLWLLLGAATVLACLGLYDDLHGLKWQLRLCVQFLVATLVVTFGWHATLFIDLPWLTGAMSVLWIVGLVNSFNMLDNMDGLSAGVAAIASLTLALVLLLAPNPELNRPQLFVGGFLLVLVGALLGFLCHNRPPARLFMGDAGSYFVGFCLATATIMAAYTRDKLPAHSVLAPLCVLAVPIYDTLTVIGIRLRQRRSPFEGDKSHFSHRLVDLGLTRPQAVLTIYLTTATCGLGAFLLNQVATSGAWIVVGQVACVLLLIGVLETTGRKAK